MCFSLCLNSNFRIESVLKSEGKKKDKFWGYCTSLGMMWQALNQDIRNWIMGRIKGVS